MLHGCSRPKADLPLTQAAFKKPVFKIWRLWRKQRKTPRSPAHDVGCEPAA
jgi:hypothetical protein